MRGMFLSCFGKKGTKEADLRGARAALIYALRAAFQAVARWILAAARMRGATGPWQSPATQFFLLRTA